MENQTAVLPDTESAKTIPSSAGSLPEFQHVFPEEDTRCIHTYRRQRMRTGAGRRWGVPIVAMLLLLGLVGAPAIDVAAPAFAADVNTIAGNGTRGFSGDGGPAIAAALNLPHGMAVAADGTVYVADTVNYRVRRIGTDGVITTVVGNGTNGDAGDGGLATAASFSGVVSIALSPADDVLYLADYGNNRVRQVDLVAGVISNFAGAGWAGFGFAGDGGPATSASFQLPESIAVDGTGNVYISDINNCVIRKVDIGTNIITTVVGSVSVCTSSGDGGPALSAGLTLPLRMAVDAAGNLFLIDSGPNLVRRVDADTNVITTVAGGGTTIPGFGDALTMDLVSPRDIALDASNNLYIGAVNQVFKVDLGTGILSVFAGTGTPGFSGDGGPAQDARFRDIGGVASRGDQVLIADSENDRIRAVASPPPTDDLIIDLATSQAVLDSLNAVPGSILMINVDGREHLVVPNATSVGLDVTLTGNDQLLVIDLHALQSVGGNITIAGNLVMHSVDLSSLATVDGSLTVTGNPVLDAILISGVTSVGGDLTVGGNLIVSDNTAATTINMSSLAAVGGSLDISGNTSVEEIDASALTSVCGTLEVSGNTSATTINMASLATVCGSLDVVDNTAATTINMTSLATVGGDLVVGGNTSATTIDMTSLASVGGNLEVSGNTSVTTVDMTSLSTVGGDLEVSDNTAATTINMSSLTTVDRTLEVSGNTGADTINMSGIANVGGDLTVVDNGDAAVNMSAGADVGGNLTVETTGTGTFDMGDGAVGGDLSLDVTGYTGISGTTPGGALDLTVTHAEAVMHLQVQAATFSTPVSFTVNRVEPVGLAPGSGLDASGSPATIDPIAAYQFNFDVPTLNRDAALSFDIELAQLDAATQTALLGALAAGTATLVTKGDAVGSVFQAFPICASAETPTVDGCVRVETLDAAGQPNSGTPAIVRFSNVVGHFSTWAVALVTPATRASRTVLCSTLGNPGILDIDFFKFNGVKGEKVTVALAPNPAGTFTPGRAALSLFGIGLLKLDATVLPNTITATLPRTGTFYVTVSEPLLGTRKFSGAYCASLESSGNAWQTFRGR